MAAALASALLVAGCGGGLEGDGPQPGSPGAPGTPAPPGGTAPPTAAEPRSGAFAWVLRPSGSTSDPRYGLSLIHPEDRGRERVIEPDSAAITDARLLSAGTLDVAALRLNAVQPHSLVYLVSGDVRRVPLQADGTAPRERVQRAQSANACRFLVEAVDPVEPLASRIAVSTAGADGRCATADDGWAEVVFDPAGVPRVAAGSGTPPLGWARDPASLRPRGWIFDRRVLFWSITGGSSVATRAAGEPAFRRVVAQGPRTAVMDDGTRLTLLEFRTDGSVGSVPLDAALTGGGEWQSAGFDADAFYVFRNSTATAEGRFTLLRVARGGTAVLSVLATGAGVMSNAGTGSTRLFATVLGLDGHRLLSIPKSGGTAQVLEVGPVTTLPAVLVGGAGVHLLFRSSNLGTPTPFYAVELFDESGTRLWATSVGGFPMALLDAGSQSLNVSESRNRFVFASGYGSRAFGDASLIAYDTVARSALTLGTLPGLAEYGLSAVYADVTAGPGTFRGGFAGRSTGTVVETQGARTFSFDAATAGSLRTAAPDR
jgi:hypothetical protein